MKILRNRFTVLLAEKAYREGRAKISRAEVVEHTGLAKTTVDRIARNEVQMYDNRVVLALCEYFGCNVGDLIVMEDVDDPDLLHLFDYVEEDTPVVPMKAIR